MRSQEIMKKSSISRQINKLLTRANSNNPTNSRVLLKLRNNLGLTDSTSNLHEKTKQLLKENGIIQTRLPVELRCRTPLDRRDKQSAQLNTTVPASEEIQKKTAKDANHFRSATAGQKIIQNIPKTPVTNPQIDSFTKKLQGLSLDLLQAKLDQTLRNKVKILLSRNTFKPEIYNEYRAKIDSQLESIFNHVMDRKNYQEGNSGSALWKVLDTKILFIEKIIAQNAGQAEILRNFYSIFAHKTTEYKKLGKENLLSKEFQETLILLEKIQKLQDSGISNTKSINSLSMSRFDYRKPTKKDYQIYRYQQPQYIMSRQPMPSSSYQQQYLKYSGVEVYKQMQNNQSQPTLKHFYKDMQTTYKGNFTGKQPSQLARPDTATHKDKIKILKMRYNLMSTPPSKQMYSSMAMLQNQYNNTRNQYSPLKIPSIESQFVSTAKSTFYSPAQESSIPCIPKDARLNQLKNQFRCL